MSLTVIQTGTSLQLLDEDGVRTPLTLPTGITLRTDVKPRWAIYNNNVILVNTPSQPLTIDGLGVVRLLTPKPPRLAPILSGVSGGSLTGTFRVKDTFVTLDAFGNVLSESDYSPISAQAHISAQALQAANIDVSPDSITLRRLYRTTDNGAVFFQWTDLDGNVLTVTQDDVPDAGLSVLGAPVLGTPPHLTLIAPFRGRLFGVGSTDIDNVRYTEAGLQYAWPVDNLIPIDEAGSDAFGITSLLPRREALGVGRRNILSQITGTGVESASDTDLSPVILSREAGVESKESACVFRDTAYFLWKDGVYTWDSSGITCISNGTASGKGNVRSWFATDDFFNRDMYSVAFAHIDPYQACYRLFLASAGSTTIDRWVEYRIDDGTWFGPHKTGLFTPISAFARVTAADRTVPIIGGPAAVFQEQTTRTDGYAVPVALDIVGKQHDGEVPDQQKYFGELSVLGNALPSGVLQVQSVTGKRDENGTIVGRTVTQNYDMTKGRQRLGRLGNGEHSQLEFTNANTGEDVQLMGYEIDPVHVVGRR